MAEQDRCAACGYVPLRPFEYHPYWVCVLVKAGIDLTFYPDLAAFIAEQTDRRKVTTDA